MEAVVWRGAGKLECRGVMIKKKEEVMEVPLRQNPRAVPELRGAKSDPAW
jgi:hypothetical protein